MPPHGCATVLKTDLEGSTALLESFPREYRVALGEHFEIIRHAITNEHGEIVKSVGDGLIAVFHGDRSATRAAGASLAFQRELGRREWPAVGRLRVRAAIDHGPAERETDGEYHGIALHRVDRILSLTPGGRTFVSAAVREAAGTLPGDGWRWRDLGHHALRHVSRAVQLHSLEYDGMPPVDGDVRAVSALNHNLPRRSQPLIGRGSEKQSVLTMLRDFELVTILGVSGCGKTRLALELAQDTLGCSVDEAWFVELSSVTDHDGVARAVLSVLGAREQSGDTPAGAVARAVGDRRVLLVLDHCDPAREAVRAFAEALLRRCPRLRILATACHPLGAADEAEFALGVLHYPAPRAAYNEGAAAPAVQLFVSRARLKRHDFKLTPENAGPVFGICRRLEGLPLAIELAAGMIRRLTVPQILDRLAPAGSRGGGGIVGALPPLEACFRVLHSRLSPKEKILFRRLAVFHGGWTDRAAEMVAADDAPGASYPGAPVDENDEPAEPIARDDVVDLLSGLIDNSLVRLTGADADEPRYRMLNSVHEYALLMLDGTAHIPGFRGPPILPSGDSDPAREAHRRYFTGFAAERERALRDGPDQERALRELADERENWTAAMEWSAREGADPRHALELGTALHWCWCLRGTPGAGRRLLERAIRRRGAARETIQARGWRALGVLHWAGEDNTSALRCYTEALAIAEELGDAPLQALILSNMGICYGEPPSHARPDAPPRSAKEAEECFNRSARLFESCGLRREIPKVLLNYAAFLMRLKHYPRAEEHLDTCIAEFRGAGDKLRLAAACHNQGEVMHLTERFAEARPRFAEACLLYLRVGNQPNVLSSMRWGVRSLLAAGHKQEAARVMAGVAEAAWQWELPPIADDEAPPGDSLTAGQVEAAARDHPWRGEDAPAVVRACAALIAADDAAPPDEDDRPRGPTFHDSPSGPSFHESPVVMPRQASPG